MENEINQLIDEEAKLKKKKKIITDAYNHFAKEKKEIEEKIQQLYDEKDLADKFLQSQETKLNEVSEESKQITDKISLLKKTLKSLGVSPFFTFSIPL